jgi:hypothetical protein
MRVCAGATWGAIDCLANHEHALAIYYMHYNFWRIHK